MKKTVVLFSALLALSFCACRKANDAQQISLTASATTVAVGQTVSVSLNSGANASSWTVSPSASATQTYSLTTSKVNYFTFSQPGTYTVSVRARSIRYDSASGQSLHAAWDSSGASKGGCTHGVDSASVSIAVTGK